MAIRTITTLDGKTGALVGQTSFEVPPDEDNRDTLQARAVNALAANSTYMAVPNPAAAQVAAQVKLLTRECSALIRLLLGKLDSVD